MSVSVTNRRPAMLALMASFLLTLLIRSRLAQARTLRCSAVGLHDRQRSRIRSDCVSLRYLVAASRDPGLLAARLESLSTTRKVLAEWLSGLSIWLSVKCIAGSKHPREDYISRARLYGADGHRRVCDCGSSSLARSRRNSVAAIHA